MLRSKRPEQTKQKAGLLVGHRPNTIPIDHYTIDKDGFFCIAFGFGISASGGGGSFTQGLKIAVQAINDKDYPFESIDVHCPTELKGNQKAYVSGGIGKPESLTNPVEFGEKVTVLLENLDKRLQKSGASLKGILPIEAGPINGLLPIYNVHAYNKDKNDPSKKIWLFDCDGAGRAVPSMTTCMYDYFETTCPISYNFLDEKKERKNVILDSNENLDGADAEQIFSSVMLFGDGKMNASIPIACWEVDSKMFMNNKSINFPVGSYTYWKANGSMFRDVYTNKEDLINFLECLRVHENKYSANAYNGLLFYGPGKEKMCIQEVVEVANDRWNVGYIRFDVKEGVSEKRLYYVNENLTISEYTYAKKKLVNLATAPSTITAFIYDKHPEPIQIKADGSTLQPGFIPYNTGDMAKIVELGNAKAEIIIAVLDPTIPGNKNFLFRDKMPTTFKKVMNGVFGQLNSDPANKENGYIFPEEINDVVPCLPPFPKKSFESV